MQPHVLFLQDTFPPHGASDGHDYRHLCYLPRVYRLRGTYLGTLDVKSHVVQILSRMNQ